MLRPVEGNGCFMSPILLRSDDPWGAAAIHDVEPFGPVSTIMPYRDLGRCDRARESRHGQPRALALHLRPAVAEDFVLGSGAYHGRMLILDRTSAKESTGHGSPLPVLVHGGPGRAGGGEEMGGVRGVSHYMQRTALQGSPAVLSSIVKQWLPGAEKPEGDVHPFRKRISELDDRLHAQDRQPNRDAGGYRAFRPLHWRHLLRPHGRRSGQSESDLRGPRRHGYLILSFAAGLFVEPAPGPVLANTGLENLRFLTPLYPGDSMRVELTVKTKSVRDEEKGEVRWAVYVFNQKDEVVATYDLLTMNTP
jgi:oxepin-CoA hydrolase/3-oxo-5,6-dehydrosuberyl-CoA semialdehyde dehydrogenase